MIAQIKTRLRSRAVPVSCFALTLLAALPAAALAHPPNPC